MRQQETTPQPQAARAESRGQRCSRGWNTLKLTVADDNLSYGLEEEIYQQYGLEKLENVMCSEMSADGQTWRDAVALNNAIYESNLPAIQALLRGVSPNALSDHRAFTKTTLHAAVHDPTILKYFLDYTNVPSSLNFMGFSPLHEAVLADKPESCRLLLDKFNEPRVKNGAGITPLHLAAQSAGYETAAVLLEKDKGALDDVNQYGFTPLHFAALYDNKRVAALLLQKGSKLSTKDGFGDSVLKLMSNKMYDVSNFFELVFDRFIYNVDVNLKRTGISVNVDYGLLTDGKDMSQINVLEEFVKCGHSKVLHHPLIESLVFLKWKQYSPLFHALITVHTTYLLSVNVFVVSVFYDQDMNSSTNSTTKTPGAGGGLHAGLYWLLVVLIYCSTFILILQESVFIYVKRWSYLTSLESWVKLCGLMLCAGTPLAARAQGAWPRHAACATVLLAWLQAMFLISRIPFWGNHVLMFWKAAVNILKIFATAMLLVIAFVICFMIQFRSAPPFDGFFAAFVKTLVMMSLEFDYETLFKDHQEQLHDSETGVRVLFLLFVVFVAIVLMNFMIGVAVSDVNHLNETSNTRRLEKQVEMLSNLNALINEGPFAKIFKHIFHNRSDYKMMQLSTEMFGSLWNAIYQPNPNPTQQQRVVDHIIEIKPAKLHNDIMVTASRNDEQIEKSVKNSADTALIYKIQALYDAIVDRPVATEEKDEGSKSEEKNSTWLRKEVTKQNEQIRSLVDENKEMKHCIENLSTKVGQLPSDILASIKEMSANKHRPSNYDVLFT